jgi:tRNA nucleotidyltransferase (CCA-adding enzyme)
MVLASWILPKRRDDGMSWEHFPHVADMGVRGRGCSREEAFEQAAIALCALTTDLVEVQPDQEIPVVCEAPDDEVLLVDWLNAIVFEMSSRHMVFSRFRVAIEGQRLRGSAWGERVDPKKHPPGVEVKGATFTELAVRQAKDGMWIAQCVVDV